MELGERGVATSEAIACMRGLHAAFDEYEIVVTGSYLNDGLINLLPIISEFKAFGANEAQDDGNEAADWAGFAGARQSSRRLKTAQILSIVRQGHDDGPCTFRANLCNVISNGWKLALAWAGVYSQHSVKLPLYLEPRVHLPSRTF